jgi:hypothetical protein
MRQERKSLSIRRNLIKNKSNGSIFFPLIMDIVIPMHLIELSIPVSSRAPTWVLLKDRNYS